MKKSSILIAASLCALAGVNAAAGQDVLTIGIRDDPGLLDPAVNGNFSGRIALQFLCDKLFDLDTEGELAPALAASWEWSPSGTEVTVNLREDVRFHDGTPFDAEAVAYNIERFKTLEGSRRRAELQDLASVEVIDPLTVRFNLEAPSVALLTIMTERAGMMLSPTATAEMTPQEVQNNPICAGPYTLAEYRPQDALVLEKFSDHWRADAYHFDQVVLRPIVDTNVRLLNLRSGDIDMAESIQPGDIAPLESDPAIKVDFANQPAYEMILFNMQGPNANEDIVANAAVREAISLAIDREAINQVLFAGAYLAGNQPFLPGSLYYNEDFPLQPRDVEAARAKMAEAGLDSVTFDVLVSTQPENLAEAEMIQAMVAEAGITMNIVPMEFVALLDRARSGDFEADIIGSAGRLDPDLTISLFLGCGQPNNAGQYCNSALDEILAEARTISNPEERKPLYDRALEIVMTEMPIIYLYHPRTAYAFDADLENFRTYPDAIIRLDGVIRGSGI